MMGSAECQLAFRQLKAITAGMQGSLALNGLVKHSNKHTGQVPMFPIKHMILAKLPNLPTAVQENLLQFLRLLNTRDRSLCFPYNNT